MNINAYCLDWHITSSDAFRDLLIDPLESHGKIILKAWNGDKLLGPVSPKKPMIFCMLPPPNSLLERRDLKLVWIPMWDQAQGYTQQWWNALPKNLRVVALSKQVAAKAKTAGLPTLYMQYFRNPSTTTPTSWQDGRIVFYWNRVGMVGPSFLEKLCQAIGAKELLFKPSLDPRIEENKKYELPHKLGNTTVHTVSHRKSRDDFLKQIEHANILISPRLTEGVGMVFLEAMSRGCAVIAHNAPTMNEYIKHCESGVLLNNQYQTPGTKLLNILRRNKSSYPTEPPFLLNDLQPWKQLGRLNYEALGKRALENHAAGFINWEKSREKYAEFIFNWQENTI